MNKICVLVFLATLYVSTNAFVDEYEYKSFPLKEYLPTYNHYADGDETTTDSPTEIPPTETPENKKNCTQAGLMCQTCEELVLCVKINGEWEQLHAQTCNGVDEHNNKESCMINKCTFDPNPECEEPATGDHEFQCRDTGVFPDPFNCHVYHVCVMKNNVVSSKPEDKDKDKHTVVRCDDDVYGYNPITTYCDKKLINNVCSRTPPVPVCKTGGQNGGIYGTSIFYICVQDDKDTYHPELYMCPHGGRFTNGSCK